MKKILVNQFSSRGSQNDYFLLWVDRGRTVFLGKFNFVTDDIFHEAKENRLYWWFQVVLFQWNYGVDSMLGLKIYSRTSFSWNWNLSIANIHSKSEMCNFVTAQTWVILFFFFSVSISYLSFCVFVAVQFEIFVLDFSLKSLAFGLFSQ